MSKIKYTVLLLGILFVTNADVHAANSPVTAPKVATTETESVSAEPSKDEAPLDAEDGDRVVTQKELQGLNSEVATLRDQLTRQLDRNIANSLRSLTIGGTLQERYTAVTSSDYPYTSNGFSVAAAILSFNGALKKDYDEGKNLTYSLSFLASAPTYNVQPYEAWLQYSIFQSLDTEKPTLYLQFGQISKPFGLEAQVGEDKKPAANTATFAGPGGFNLAARDIGIKLRGDLFPHFDPAYNYRVPFIEYSAALINGSGPNASDSNKSKDVVARIAFNAPVDYSSDFRGLTFGNSLYSGKKALLSNGAIISGGQGGASTTRFGQDLSYVSSPIGFTAEYAVGKDEALVSGTNVANAITATTQSRGYTFTLFYEWGEQFLTQARLQNVYDDWWPKTYQPFIRFDHWDPNTAVAGNETSILTYGFNLFFAQTTKLQLNYNVSVGKTPNLPNNNTNTFVAQFQYGF